MQMLEISTEITQINKTRTLYHSDRPCIYITEGILDPCITVIFAYLENWALFTIAVCIMDTTQSHIN